MSLHADPSWLSDLGRLLSLQDANTRTALLGTGLLGLASGVVGVFAMFRKRALVGDAIAHAALPGVCIAFLIVGSKSFAALLVGALVIGLIAAGCISVVRSMTRIKEDAITAIVIGVFFGLGIVLLSRIQSLPTGNQAGLEGFLFGKAASMVAADARAITIVAGVVLVAVAVLFKELRSLCFDRVFSEALGYPVRVLDLGLMALVCLCTIAGLPAVGVVLVVAMLTIPAAAARFWSDRLNVVVVLAGAIGAVSGVMGTALSAVVPAPAGAGGAGTRGWATGPVIVLCAAVVFVVSALVSPRRGVVAEAMRNARSRLRRLTDHALRRAVEESERAGAGFSGSVVVPGLGALPAMLLRWRGLARRARGARGGGGGALELTERGVGEAQRVVKAHRLWELFLIEHAAIASDHVHRDADELEHLIPASLLKDLEARLAGETAGARVVPPSPHVIAGFGAEETGRDTGPTEAAGAKGGAA